jgi:hypothetical protein
MRTGRYRSGNQADAGIKRRFHWCSGRPVSSVYPTAALSADSDQSVNTKHP